VLPENLEQQRVKNSFTRGLQLYASLALPPIIIFFIGIKNFGTWVLIQAISQLAIKFKLIVAVIGESLALSSAATYFYVDAHRTVGIAFSKLKDIIMPPVLGALVVSPLALLMSWAATIANVSSHIASWVFSYAFFAVCLYSLLWKLGFLRRDDLLFIRETATMIFRRAGN